MRKTLIVSALLAALGGLFVVGVYQAAWGEGRCASCHDGGAFVDATREAAHAPVACLACHTPGDALGRVAFGVRHLPVMVGFGSEQRTRDLSTVSDSRCLECHEGVYARLVSANGVRIEHAACTPGIECTECHSATAHGEAVSWVRTYDMETCLACHVSEELADCAVCHDGRLPADRLTTGVFAVTHGPQWETTHGMGNPATCSACHTAADCATCHGVGLPHGQGFLADHADYSTRDEARCESCHEPAFCDGCHGLEMPHPQRFIIEHATPADEDRALCSRCHAESDCIVCHETHVHPGGSIGSLSQDDDAR